jgi:hypothetical protein
MPVTAKGLQGLKYFKVLGPLLERLHEHGTQRDRAGNRRLHFDQYACLLLLFFYNPIITSLRGIQQASLLAKVQKLLGCKRAALGSLSEASRVFDAEALQPIIAELAAQALPMSQGKEVEALRGLTAVDGSFLLALPRMAWALFQDENNRAVKMHVHFDVLKGVPCDVSVTTAIDPEQDQLRAKLQPGRLYVIDRGYAVYQLFQDILDGQSSFVGRVRNDAAFKMLHERPLTAAAHAAGVLRDCQVQLGAASQRKVLHVPVRLVWVGTGKLQADGTPEILVLATNRFDLDAELVALAYKYRWSVELFFRWLKCTLGCRHLLANSQNGVTMQVYLAIIASLLISLWVGKKPTKRTFEMLQFYFTGWATEAELLAHLDKLYDQPD